ncbi:MAG: sigma-54 interaction domain-containing protein [Gammaproteobacteria bacterium]
MATGNLITLASLLETHDEPLVVIDSALAIVAINSTYEKRFGVTSDEVVGRPCHQVFEGSPASGRARLPYESQMRFFRGPEPYSEVRSHLDNEGEVCQVNVRGYPLVGTDQTVYLGESHQPLTFSPATRNNSFKMAGASDPFKRLLARLDQAAACNAAVLLRGETGTGKELAAEYIHRHSTRHGKPFVVVDCTVLTQELCESELFGHEKGAFTGSAGNRKGLFEAADGGTLFLDELGEMPLRLQAKLLRALENGSFRRVGSSKSCYSDVRVVCATNRDLSHMVKMGHFRQDLFYRVGVFPIRLPPLRERRDDIPLLVQALLLAISAGTGALYRISQAALDRLMPHPFPGNIRELRNALQLATSLCPSREIGPEHIHLAESEGIEDAEADRKPLPDQREEDDNTEGLGPLEQRYIAQLLKKHNGNKSKVADILGISERTLYRKISRLRNDDS